MNPVTTSHAMDPSFKAINWGTTFDYFDKSFAKGGTSALIYNMLNQPNEDIEVYQTFDVGASNAQQIMLLITNHSNNVAITSRSYNAVVTPYGFNAAIKSNNFSAVIK